MTQDLFGGFMKYLFRIIIVFLVFAPFAIAVPKGDEYAIYQRPGKDSGPTEVEFFVFVLDVKDIDGAEQKFRANFFLELNWKDKSLIKPGEMPRKIPLEEAWNPRMLIANRIGFLPKSFDDVLQVAEDGTVKYAQRIVGDLSQRLHLTDFPFDRHRFTMPFVASEYSDEEIKFVPGSPAPDSNISGGGISNDLSVPDWRIGDFSVEPRSYTPVENLSCAGFVFEFTAMRYWRYYLWQVYIPLAFIVIMSWACFWIDPEHAEAQITVATASMLTLIAFRFTLAKFVPHLPYMTKMDYYTLGCTAIVFLTFVEVAFTTVFSYRQKHAIGRKMDRICRWLVPGIFVTWSVGSII